MFQRLLICTDFQDGLQRLVHFISSLAGANLEQVVFLHCVPLWESGEIPRIDEERMGAARLQLSHALEQVPDGVSVYTEISSGRTVDLILKAAEKYHSDLILLGTATRDLLEETFFGSTAISLYQQSPLPLMLMRPQFTATLTDEELDLRCRHLFRQVLLPYDGSDAAQQLVQRINEAMRQHPEPSLEAIYLCWVVEDVSRRDIPRDSYVKEAEKQLVQVKQELRATNRLKVEYRVRLGIPVVEILQEAKDRGVSAVMLSSKMPNRLVNWSAPSFTKDLFHRSWHPIIYVPPSR